MNLSRRTINSLIDDAPFAIALRRPGNNTPTRENVCARSDPITRGRRSCGNKKATHTALAPPLESSIARTKRAGTFDLLTAHCRIEIASRFSAFINATTNVRSAISASLKYAFSASNTSSGACVREMSVTDSAQPSAARSRAS